ncbi:MAG: hypothetical protein ABI661_02935 [Gammaproteobacteria bacterium]
MNRSFFLGCVLIGTLPLSAMASTEWATWNTAASNLSSIGSFADGRTVQLTSFFETITGPAAASTIYNVSPAVPGQANGRNPSFTYALTGPGPYPNSIARDDVAASIDLTNYTVNGDTIFGLADLKFQYRLELQDSGHNPLALTGLVTTDYNLTYDGSGLIADLGCFFQSAAAGTTPAGVIFVGGSGHDAGGTYVHSGLCTFTNLPTETKFIRILARGVTQETEGIHVLLAGTASAVPLPATAPLLGTAVAFVLARARRRKVRGA